MPPSGRSIRESRQLCAVSNCQSLLRALAAPRLIRKTFTSARNRLARWVWDNQWRSGVSSRYRFSAKARDLIGMVAGRTRAGSTSGPPFASRSMSLALGGRKWLIAGRGQVVSIRRAHSRAVNYF